MRDRDFERLYAEHAEPLLGFLVYRTGDRALAEDLLGDTFERVLRSRGRFDPRRSGEKTWLYTIALNLLRDHARRAAAGRRAHDKITAATGAPGHHSQEFSAVEDRDAVQRAMGTLSSEERDVIALRYGADLTLPEIAKLTQEKLTTVEGRVYRALRKLKGELE
ncbi:MAG: sigma-70 family RNA polymerase sigma factor [Actinomycetota bacterium]|nr:sigma-70 family RNA polymerase sigma factor [Actinomycetota bacterium]